AERSDDCSDHVGPVTLGRRATERFLLSFFFNDTATTEIYTLSLHDALPISGDFIGNWMKLMAPAADKVGPRDARSEEHTSELQSHLNLLCRLLLEKKNKHTKGTDTRHSSDQRCRRHTDVRRT